MALLEIIPGTGTRARAITDLIESIAIQEAALSSILDAEGENIQAVIAMPDMDPAQLMEMNSSANQLIDSVTRLENMLQTTLELFPSDDPQATTAAAELANINVLIVAIDTLLDDPAAPQAAITQTIAAAQAQAAPAYTVDFAQTAYVPGMLAGTFIITNGDNPADSAFDTAPRAVIVTATATA